MASLTISVDTDFSTDVLNNVQNIEFTNVMVGATATFHHSQVDDIQILHNAAVIGSAGANHLVFDGGEVNLKYFTFSNWSNGADRITINGSSSTDSLVGSSQNDVIDGKGGKDTLNGQAGADILIGGTGKDKMYGGAGNDTFWLTANPTTNDVAFGEIINGGSGTDTLLVQGSTYQDHYFRWATLTSIEVLQFGATSLGGVEVQLNASQIGLAGGITQVNDMADNSLFVTGTLVDLSSVVFGTAPSGFVDISVAEVGLVADDASLTGSDQNDSFRPNTTGVLSVFGGDGDDQVSYSVIGDRTGHSIDGVMVPTHCP